MRFLASSSALKLGGGMPAIDFAIASEAAAAGAAGPRVGISLVNLGTSFRSLIVILGFGRRGCSTGSAGPTTIREMPGRRATDPARATQTARKATVGVEDGWPDSRHRFRHHQHGS